jgi:hypothetical protein
MSNGSPTPTVGSWVQYNVTTQSPLSALPTAAENTIGLVRQAFTAQGKQFLQVVWNPGAMLPQTGLYTSDQLCPITQQQAANIQAEMNAGTYDPSKPQGTPGSNYQQPEVPSGALPPGLQNVPVIPTLTGPTDQPISGGYS